MDILVLVRFRVLKKLMISSFQGAPRRTAQHRAGPRRTEGETGVRSQKTTSQPASQPPKTKENQRKQENEETIKYYFR